MAQTTVFLLAAPHELSQAARWDAPIAHHRYHIGPGFRLFSRGCPPPCRGGLMALSDQGYDGHPFRSDFCHEVLRECLRRGFSGVMADFESSCPALAQCLCRLDALLPSHGATLYINESYVPAAPGARVLISSALSGGTLQQRLEQALGRYGCARTVLAVERVMEDFTLPAPTGCGRPLSPGTLEELLRQTRTTVFFSRPLGARYFTYPDPADRIHLVLFDDTDTLIYKLDTARRAGIAAVVLPWREISCDPRRFGLSPRQNKNF